ncbi:lysophospholipid acyltransferase 5 [Apis cerana]|nr:lysophospholipid acyltransferase 5 [Apis cerana]
MFNIVSFLSEHLNVPEAATRLFLSILVGFPIAFIHRYTLYGKYPIYQHIFFITCGVSICLWNFGFNLFHSGLAVYTTYGILKYLGGSSLAVFIIFVFNIVYLFCGYYLTSTGGYDIKWTMPQCVLTLRLIGIAFDMLDGQKPEETLSLQQKQVALKDHPTFLEIAAFSYFPASFIVGPQFSMKRYLDFVQGRYTSINTDGNFIVQEIEIRDSIIPGIFQMFLGIIYMILHQLGTWYIPHEYILSMEFRQQPFLKRIFIIGLWGHVNLYKYVSCWLLAEGVCTIFGLSYNGRDEKGRPLWNGCTNINVLKFETATKFKHYIISFNISTNNWCAEYIYKRLKVFGSITCSQILTLLFLAVWHGVHSGYYFCFFLEFIIMYAERDLTKILEKQEKLQKLLENRLELRILVWIFLRLHTLALMGYCLVCFTFLSYSVYHQVYSSLYHYGLLVYLIYALISVSIKFFFFKKHLKQLE